MPVNILECLPISDPIPSITSSGSCLSSFDPYDLSSDEEYLAPNNVAEMTRGRSDRTAGLFTAAQLYLISLPEAPKNWGEMNPNLNDVHSDPMKISSTYWVPDITNWWCQQEEMHSKYTDLSNAACDIFSTIPVSLGVKACYSFGQVVIVWRQSNTTGMTLCEKVIVRLFAGANNGMLAGADTELDTTNTENVSERKKEAEERKRTEWPRSTTRW
jgi:hypothetical protein